MVEQFYTQSEQHPLKIVMSDTSDTALGLVALPEYDEEWMAAANVEAIAAGEDVQLTPMRTVSFAFACECSSEKLIPFFRTLTQDALSDLYGADSELLITCPRCGKKFEIERSVFEPEQ